MVQVTMRNVLRIVAAMTLVGSGSMSRWPRCFAATLGNELRAWIAYKFGLATLFLGLLVMTSLVLSHFLGTERQIALRTTAGVRHTPQRSCWPY